MTHEPLVSIVIPTFNHAEMLRRALQSVVSQTYTNWQAIIVNNFSSDNTLEVVNKFEDSRFHVINFANHGVIAASRNKGISLSKGEYIAFLDSDDTWSASKLESCMKILELEADLVCHAEHWIDENEKTRLVTYGPRVASTHHNLIYRGNRISTSATVVRTSLLSSVGGFDVSPELISTEDYDLWIRLAAISDKFFFIHEPLGRYYRHDNNVSSNIEKHLNAELALLQKHFSYHHGLKYSVLKRRRLALAHYGAGRSFHRTGKHVLALRKYTCAFLLWPLSFRLLAAIVLSCIGLITPKTK